MLRVDGSPGYLLHARAWRESSQLLEVLTPQHGRVGLVARGTRSKRGQGGVLQIFQPLLLSWVTRGELGTLDRVEAGPPGARLSGEGLLCGLYVNELLVRALPRGEGDALVFVAYAEVLEALAVPEPQAWALRRFELRLLQALGHLPDPLCEAQTGLAPDPDRHYRLLPGEGLQPVAPDTPASISGSDLLALADGRRPEPAALARFRPVLRALLGEVLGAGRLRSADWMLELRRLGKA